MNTLDINHWQYQYGQPKGSAGFKLQLTDFVVTEHLGYQPCGEGEHIYLWVRKQGLNTAYVAEQIARFCQLPLRNVTYAGRKDKYATTYQWFGVHAPGKQDFDWSQLHSPQLQVESAARHNKKLRTGALQGNRFRIRLREVSEKSDVEARLSQIERHGVPNYFGAQRFGESRFEQQPGNLALAMKMLEGEAIRNRNKRSMAISALRAWLFNEFVHRRLLTGHHNQMLAGDVCILSGSNSFFCATEIDETLQQRLAQQDIQLSAPMWGKGTLASQGAALNFESQVAEEFNQVTSCLESLGLQQERRAIQLHPTALSWSWQDQDLVIEFDLPSGCFATSVIRELVQIRPHQEEANHANPAE